MLELLEDLCRSHELTDDHLTAYNFFSDWMGTSTIDTLEQLQNDVEKDVIPFYDIPIKYFEVYDVDRREVIDYTFITRFGNYAIKFFNGAVGDEIYHFTRVHSPFYQTKYVKLEYPTPAEVYTLMFGPHAAEYKWRVGSSSYTQLNAIKSNYYNLPKDFRDDLISYPNKYNIITYSRKVYGSRVVVSHLTKIPLSFNAIL